MKVAVAEASNHYFGLDVGTSTVRCVVGMVDPANPSQPSVIGHGSAPNTGMRRGIVVHVDEVVEAMVQAVTEAERVSGIQIKQATININGSHVSGMNSKGVIAISTANREISPHDRLRVEEAATIIQLPANREIIQVFAKNYRVDGQDNIKDPVGMHGVRLEVDTHIVTAATPNLRSLDIVLEKANVAPTHRTVSSLAAAEAVLNRQQKESGTLLLDMGAGTTNVVVVEDGEVQHIAVIPMGGKDITNDLAIGLKTDLDIAEQVKLEHGGIGEKAKLGRISVQHGGRAHYFDRSGDYGTNNIIEARVEHILEFVEKELKKINRTRKLPGGVVLVGGTAKIPGIAEFTREKLQLAARLGSLQPLGGIVDTVQDISYTSAVGLMVLDMLLLPEPNAGAGAPSSGVLGVIEGILGRFRK
ncbi:cell division protein FtsA [soil metagenome]